MRTAFLAACLSLAAQGKEPGALDAVFEAGWKKLNLKPAPPCDDATFLRRVSLDLTGTLPAPEDVRAFLRSSQREKRQAKIDELLAGPKAADYFAQLWVQWLMGHDVESRDLQRIDFGALTRWLRAAWEKDLSYDDLVRAFLTARGDPREVPPAAFFAKHLRPDEPPARAAAQAARLFLGRDIRCAQCHDHPYEELTQEEFWGFAAFLRPLALRGREVVEVPVQKPPSAREDVGELFSDPRFLDGRAPDPGEAAGPALARLTLTTRDRAASRAVVERVWKLLFGRTLAPRKGDPGRPEVLDFLSEGLARNGGSLRWLVRTMAGSRIYQLSSEGPERPRREYAAGPLKMMNTIQFMRAWNFAFAREAYFRRLYEKDPSRAPYFRDPDAFWVGQSMDAKEMLFPKGRDPEEFMANGTDRLALKLMNNRDLQLLMIAKYKETQQYGLVWKVINDHSEPGRRVDELFLLMIGRPPAPGERAWLLDHVKGNANPFQPYADVFWVLFNSAEFIFIG